MVKLRDMLGRGRQASFELGSWGTPAGQNVLPPRRGDGFQLGPTFGASESLNAPDDLLAILAGISSQRVSRADALSVPAVLRARNMIAGIPSTLPIRVHDKTYAIDERNSVVADPDPDTIATFVYAATIEDLLFESKSYWKVERFGADGYPVEARHVNLRSIAQHAVLGMPSEVISEDLQFSPRDPVFIDGRPIMNPREIIRFVSPNPPLLKHAARAIRILLLLDAVAEIYANDPIGLGYFTDREDADPLEDTEVTKILDDWQAARRQRAFGYVPQSLELRQIQWNADQIQLIEARQHAVLELARATGLDPEDIGVSTTSRTYQNAEQRRTDLIDFVLMPYMNAIEDTLTKFALPATLHARFDVSGFLRSSTKERMEANKIGKEIGAITGPEIRGAEHRPPLTPAEESALEQRNRPVVPAAPSGNGKAPTEDRMSNGQRATFEDSSDLLRLDFPEVAETFRVDPKRRLVSGMILPWGKVAYSSGFKWRFARGSVELPAELGRVKLLRDHDMTRAVGKMVDAQDREDGLYGTFFVKRGLDGDATLSEAEDGVLDGFSVGPAFESPDSWRRDPSAADVRLVEHSRLVETTITAIPAFDDARVASVIASRVNEGAGMAGKDDDKGKGGDGQGGGNGATVLDTPNAAMERFTRELEERFVKLTEHVEKSAQASGDAIAKAVSDAVVAAFGRLEDRDATGRGAEAFARIKVISEPPVYRFDGDVTAPSLVKDAWTYHMDGNFDARDRLRKFQQQQQDLVKFATVTTASVPEVIPPGYRPDLYVTQLMQGRPLVSMASRGTISDATPFKVPRFVTATGATADHVQGVNPTDGVLDVDDVTVTPGAVSGLFKLTREIVDSANPAIDAIAMQAMRESWNRQTEQKAYAELNVDANVGTFTNVTQAQLIDNLGTVIGFVRDLLAQYPFVRFASPTGAVMGQPVTRNFANAKDSTGRPLLPSVGAQNTAGLGNAVQQGWFVDGLPFVPAWAITTNLGDEAALILQKSDWWVWESPLLTFRFEERSGPALIELALFGYYATKVLRPAGIMSLREVA